MTAALILYGSRARGGAKQGSDVDLIYADEGNSIGTPQVIRGISIHFYSQGWLEAQSRSGSLFAYHIAFEGISLNQTDKVLQRIRESFTKRHSYRDNQSEALLILKFILEKDWGFNLEARRRYFWAIRTIFICESAELGSPQFASEALEKISGIERLAAHIDDRASASFNDCRRYGESILSAFRRQLPTNLRGDELRAHLTGMGGIGLDSVRIVEEQEAVEGSGLQIYL